MQPPRPRPTLVSVLTAAAGMASTVSLAALIAFNLVPLVGVLFWGWSLMLILVLYWLESGIVGVINVFKIALARGTAPPGTQIRIAGSNMVGRNVPQVAGCLVPFFIVHYGIFWVVHGVFVLTLPLFAGIGRFGGTDLTNGATALGTTGFGAIDPGALLLAGIGLAVSHVSSFLVNYIGRREYLRVSPGEQMFSVYGRVVALHLTIIAGGFLIALLGTPVAALAVLVVMKILLDLRLHLRERQRATIPVSAG